MFTLLTQNSLTCLGVCDTESVLRSATDTVHVKNADLQVNLPGCSGLGAERVFYDFTADTSAFARTSRRVRLRVGFENRVLSTLVGRQGLKKFYYRDTQRRCLNAMAKPEDPIF